MGHAEELFIEEATTLFNSIDRTIYEMRETGVNLSDDIRQDLLKIDKIWEAVIETDIENGENSEEEND
jgi:hypothetical protein